MKKETKTVKAWAVLLTDKNAFQTAFDLKNDALVYANQFYGAKTVPCTITYTLPTK